MPSLNEAGVAAVVAVVVVVVVVAGECRDPPPVDLHLIIVRHRKGLNRLHVRAPQRDRARELGQVPRHVRARVNDRARGSVRALVNVRVQANVLRRDRCKTSSINLVA